MCSQQTDTAPSVVHATRTKLLRRGQNRLMFDLGTSLTGPFSTTSNKQRTNFARKCIFCKNKTPQSQRCCFLDNNEYIVLCFCVDDPRNAAHCIPSVCVHLLYINVFCTNVCFVLLDPDCDFALYYFQLLFPLHFYSRSARPQYERQ